MNIVIIGNFTSLSLSENVVVRAAEIRMQGVLIHFRKNMITQNKLFIAMAISYLIGIGIGYILKLDETSFLSSKITGVLIGMGFATYIVATVLDIREK